NSIDTGMSLDGEVRHRQISLTQIRKVVSHFVLHHFAEEAFIHLLFDLGCKNVSTDNLGCELPYDLLDRHATKVQKRAISDHVAVLPVHYQDHLLQAFDHSLVFPQRCLRPFALGDIPESDHSPIQHAALI